MPSPAEYAANRLSRQPVMHAPSAETTSGRAAASEQGRKRSSLNALRHGLTARVVVLPSEDMAAYRVFAKEIVDSLTGPLYGGLSLDAQTPVERQFAQTVADNQWRINRIRSIEDGMLAQGHFESAGNFDADNPEIHSVMTAARAFRDKLAAVSRPSLIPEILKRREAALVRPSPTSAFTNSVCTGP